MIDGLMTRRGPYDDYGHKFPSTWVQMAIIAMNSASEASAAASLEHLTPTPARAFRSGLDRPHKLAGINNLFTISS